MHFYQLSRYGDFNKPPTRFRFRTSRPPIDRLMAHMVVTPGILESDCWLSTYALTREGYARITIDNRRFSAHRIAYEHFVGPIPDGMQLDHLCRVRHCVNPAHLEPVTALINTRRGMSPGQIVIRSGLCRRGHSMDDAYVNSSNRRHCRTCQSIGNAARYQREKLRRLTESKGGDQLAE